MNVKVVLFLLQGIYETELHQTWIMIKTFKVTLIGCEKVLKKEKNSYSLEVASELCQCVSDDEFPAPKDHIN